MCYKFPTRSSMLLRIYSRGQRGILSSLEPAGAWTSRGSEPITLLHASQLFLSKPRQLLQHLSGVETLLGAETVLLLILYIMLTCSALTSPPWYGPPRPWAPALSPLGYARLLTFHIRRLFPHLVKFLANTMQFNTTCNDYDCINQHSHQSTRTTRPQGGRGANHHHAQIGRERRWSISTSSMSTLN